MRILNLNSKSKLCKYKKTISTDIFVDHIIFLSLSRRIFPKNYTHPSAVE